MAATATRRTNQTHLSGEVEKLKDDLITVRHDIGELADSFLNIGRDKASAAGDAMKGSMDQTVRRGRKAVQRRPLASLAVAAGAGLAAGWLISRL